MDPTWPLKLASKEDALAFLSEASTPSLLQAEYNKHFFAPDRMKYAQDITAYTKLDGSAYYTYLLGQASSPVAVTALHRKFKIVVPSGVQEDMKWFQRQIGPLADAVAHDEADDYVNGRYYDVATCTDGDRDAGIEGSYMNVHVSYAGWIHCTMHTAVDGTLAASIPPTTSDWPLQAGDWVLILATLHKRESDAYEDRDYEILARHLRVLQFENVESDSTLSDVPSPAPGSKALKRAQPGGRRAGARTTA
ncbi:hypothetical protein B0H15DRAFT_949503 [Mycena belliarum]|uniref:Uncharacterized protein n=1 Tax=Mycena belliarum TaxID=1033014 RepID=A0AAD6XME0_9AGAR|nr:hypothetical protein B0H15DRAFT_949503 [Mycena belliae]